jgi:hypothetical protein
MLPGIRQPPASLISKLLVPDVTLQFQFSGFLAPRLPENVCLQKLSKILGVNIEMLMGITQKVD